MPQRAYSSTTSAAAVRSLGITQDDLAMYLGVSRGQVAHLEAGRRELATPAHIRLLRLSLLVPPPWGAGAPESPSPPLPLPPPALPLPIAPPVVAAGGLAESKLVQRRWRRCEYLALVLRRDLAARAAREASYRRRADVVEALGAASALPDDTPALTARWCAWLTADTATKLRPGGPADSIVRALAEVKLYRLEAEAATLAYWLHAAG